MAPWRDSTPDLTCWVSSTAAAVLSLSYGRLQLQLQPDGNRTCRRLSTVIPYSCLKCRFGLSTVHTGIIVITARLHLAGRPGQTLCGQLGSGHRMDEPHARYKSIIRHR
jgi:hypothetical protein